MDRILHIRCFFSPAGRFFNAIFPASSNFLKYIRRLEDIPRAEQVSRKMIITVNRLTGYLCKFIFFYEYNLEGGTQMLEKILQFHTLYIYLCSHITCTLCIFPPSSLLQVRVKTDSLIVKFLAYVLCNKMLMLRSCNITNISHYLNKT